MLLFPGGLWGFFTQESDLWLVSGWNLVEAGEKEGLQVGMGGSCDVVWGKGLGSGHRLALLGPESLQAEQAAVRAFTFFRLH